MTVDEWAIVIGVFSGTILALAPWMFTVHAKLAVLTATITSLEAKVDKLIDDNGARMPMCAAHAARLDAFESRLAGMHARLEKLADAPNRRE